MHKLLCFMGIILTKLTFSQSNFSESFMYSPKNIQVFIPSTACLNNKIESNLTYRTYTGKLSIINTYYADLNYNFQDTTTHRINPKHVVGLGFYNDKEGNFFNKLRIIGRYAYHIPIKDSIYWALGAAVHYINYNFHSSGSGAMGSDNSWSGNISSTIYGESWNFSLAYNDFNNPVLRPINYEFRTPHYFTIFGEKTFNVNFNTQWKSSCRLNLANDKKTIYVLQTGIILSKIVGLNYFYYATKGSGFNIDINQLNLYKTKIDLSVAYFIPKKTGNPPVNQFEFNIKFNIPKK